VLDEITNNESLRNRYLKTFKAGDVLFHEGDDSQDLYILISGHLEVFKGDKKLSEIIDPGSVLGEAAFLLGAKRTATVKAEESVAGSAFPKPRWTGSSSSSLLQAKKSANSSPNGSMKPARLSTVSARYATNFLMP
jgi:hypothetical protein